jgi:YD repeat-containing protein
MQSGRFACLILSAWPAAKTTGTDWPDPTYDLAGNTTKAPQPLSSGNSYELKYDAWNRLVEVKATGGAVVATHRYNGLSRRVTKDDLDSERCRDEPTPAQQRRCLEEAFDKYSSCLADCNQIPP